MLNLFPEPQPPLAAEFALTDQSNLLIHYLGDVFDWHGYVKFVSLAALRETSRDVPLEKLFVEPSVSPQYLSPDALEATPPPATQRISTALLEHPRVVLLGDPGSGKSTIVNWICTVSSRSTNNSLTGKIGAPLVPVPLVLRELGLGRDFVRLSEPGLLWDRLLELFLARPVAAHLHADREKHSRFEDSLLGRMLITGQAFMLLDGIDEIGSLESRSALRDAVHEGMRRYPRCRWLLTSRVVGYDEIPFDSLSSALAPEEYFALLDEKMINAFPPKDTGNSIGEGFIKGLVAGMQKPPAVQAASRFYLAPFDNDQVEQFTRLWWAHHESNPHLAGTKPTQFLNALRQSPGARSLARLPHLLTMIALIYRVRAELPDGRALLYSLIADAYLGTLDKERGLEHLRPIPHGVDEMSRWLAAVAWHLQRQRTEKPDAEAGVFITRSELLDLLSKVIPPKPDDSSHHVAELFVDYVARRSALLLPRGQAPSGDDLYAFLHLSFQEYFAAQFLRDRVADPEWRQLDAENEQYGTRPEDLQRYATLPVWRETLIFLFESAALVSRVFPQRLTERLFHWPRDVSKWRDFRVPTVEQLKSKQSTSQSQANEQGVALVAGLSVNPHVVLDPLARTSLWERCWRWELKRQRNIEKAKNFSAYHRNDVARELLSRPSSERDTVGVLLRVAATLRVTLLNLERCLGLSDLAPLAKLTGLTQLNLNECASVTDLAPVASLSKLKMLYLGACTGLTDLTPVAKLGRLTVLSVRGWRGSIDLIPLARLAKLFYLDCTSCQELTDLSPLANLANLSYLSLFDCPQVVNLTPLADLVKLRDLDLSWCIALADVSPLANLADLYQLNLDWCAGLADIAPLAKLTKLETLGLEGCTKLTDLAPLSSLVNLKDLDLKGCTGLAEAQIQQLQQVLPKAKIER
jgi:internalin A